MIAYLMLQGERGINHSINPHTNQPTNQPALETLLQPRGRSNNHKVANVIHFLKFDHQSPQSLDPFLLSKPLLFHGVVNLAKVREESFEQIQSIGHCVCA
jgi:hypothetical protein